MAAPVCATELDKLYAAISALNTGKSVVSVGFGERSVSYNQAQLPQLLKLWQTWYRVCGATSGYPDFSQPVERGAPAFARVWE